MPGKQAIARMRRDLTQGTPYADYATERENEELGRTRPPRRATGMGRTKARRTGAALGVPGAPKAKMRKSGEHAYAGGTGAKRRGKTSSNRARVTRDAELHAGGAATRERKTGRPSRRATARPSAANRTRAAKAGSRAKTSKKRAHTRRPRRARAHRHTTS